MDHYKNSEVCGNERMILCKSCIKHFTKLQARAAFLILLLLPSCWLHADPPPPDATYRTLPTVPFAEVKRDDEAQKPKVMRLQKTILEERYDLSNKPSAVKMSGGRKAVQSGVRVKIPTGMSWEELAKMTLEDIRDKELLPRGFIPLPHVKQATGGQVFPQKQIDEIRRQEANIIYG